MYAYVTISWQTNSWPGQFADKSTSW